MDWSQELLWALAFCGSESSELLPLLLGTLARGPLDPKAFASWKML